MEAFVSFPVLAIVYACKSKNARTIYLFLMLIFVNMVLVSLTRKCGARSGSPQLNHTYSILRTA